MRRARCFFWLQPACQSLEISEGTRLVYNLEGARSPAKIGELSCRVSGMYGE